jgi:Tfp pilus assembly protein PilF
LLIQSQTARDAGDLSGAAETVERALTIAPDEALLWVELAEIRMAQGDGVLAQEMARKALTLTMANSPVAVRARRLIVR